MTRRIAPKINPAIAMQAILIIAATVFAYWPALQAQYIWDDDMYVTENVTLRTANGLYQIWATPTASPDYYPLTFTTFWIEYQLWGLNAIGYHVVNVLLHALNALLLWRVLERLNIPGAVVAATVFALHPVHVESVAWITERKNVLSGAMYLLAMLSYLSFGDAMEQNRRRWGWYGIALVLYIGAMLAKTVTISLPAVLLVIDWWKHGRLTKRHLQNILPFVLVGLPMGIFAIYLQHHHTGATGDEFGLTLIERIILAGRILWFYVGKILWPANLMFIYPKWDVDARSVLQYVPTVAILLALSALWLFRNRIGRAPLAAALIFGITLAPAVGFFNIFWFRYSYVADHVQYIASIAIITLVVAATVAGLEWCLKSRHAHIAAGVLVIPLAFLTWRQAHAYYDHETLWKDTLAKNPGSWIALDHLGGLALAAGELEKAETYYRSALDINPDHHEAHLGLSRVYEARGDAEKSFEHMRIAAEMRPNHAYTRYQFANFLLRRGDTAGWRAEVERIVEFEPRFEPARTDLALQLQREGKLDEAIYQFEQAIHLTPQLYRPRVYLANLLRQLGRPGDALQQMIEARRLAPDNAIVRNGTGVLLMELGRRQEAAAEFEAAIKIDPTMQSARDNLRRARGQ